MSIKLITTDATEDIAHQYKASGYCDIALNPDNTTYTVRHYSTPNTEVKPFGYRLRDDDDWNNIYNAWISPLGTVYYVFYWGHEPFARAHRNGATINDLESAGWVHWSYGNIANTNVRMTRAQRDSVVYLMIGIGQNECAERLLREG